MENHINEEKVQPKNIEKLQKHPRRSSFFGYSSAETCDKAEKYKSDELELYMKKMDEEINEWPSHYADIREKLANFWYPKDSEQDEKEIMTKEQRDFLDKAVDVNEYLQESKRICDKIENYILKKEWFMERYQYCIEMMQDKLKEKELELSVAERSRILDHLQ